MAYRDGNLNFYYYGDDKATAGTGKGAQRFPDIVDAARASGQKFEDPLFPANSDSLGKPQVLRLIPPKVQIAWCRPAEIAQALVNKPPIFLGDYSEFGVNQGTVGDCWFLSVLADAALKPAAINTIVPADNKTIGFDTGAFHFRFWCRGKWVDVVIDDRLPCFVVDGEIKATIFCKPTAGGEFWAALFEKAYAKVYGQYAHIELGSGADAMLDITGGYIEQFDGSSPSSYLIEKIKDLKKVDAFITFGTWPQIPEKLRVPHNPNDPGQEHVSKEGIVASHEYSFIDIQDVTDRSDPTKVTTLLRLRNPWGNATEWKGDFSDTDPKNCWDNVTPDLRTPPRADGEFWIPFDAYQRYLAVVDTCRWSDKYRGDESGNVEGYSFFSLNGNFTAQASGSINGKNDIRGKGGVYVHLKALKPNTQGGESYCQFSLTMMYLNYTKSGDNPDIPNYGVYVLWAPGYVKPDSDEFFNNATSVFVNSFAPRRRRTNLIWNFAEGTVLIVPWLGVARADSPPYFLRILAEGYVHTL